MYKRQYITRHAMWEILFAFNSLKFKEVFSYKCNDVVTKWPFISVRTCNFKNSYVHTVCVLFSGTPVLRTYSRSTYVRNTGVPLNKTRPPGPD